MRSMKVWRRHWFLLALLAVLSLGFMMPQTFAPLTNLSLARNLVVATVMFLMALPLETRIVWQTLRQPGAAAWGVVINMGLVPILAWAASHLLAGDLAMGLIVAATVPCTLASAAVWTRRAGGNEAAAIFVTLITNATCFLTTPFWLRLLTQTSAQLDVLPMIVELGTLVVLPMLIAQLLRISATIATVATRRKLVCGNLAQLGILWMVLTGAVACTERLDQTGWSDAVSLREFLLMLFITGGVHLTALFSGYASARLWRMSAPNQIAVGIAGSQKTLMIGLHIAIKYFGGLTLLPMITYHVLQLFLDTVIADYWARRQAAAKTN